MDKKKKAKTKDFETLNKDLLKLLGEHDAKAIHVIDEIMELGRRKKDKNIVGYAYYRYAYYYYFTSQNTAKFRKHIEIAIKYLLRTDDKEYLGSTYNLVAYDAQDQGHYDTAYAYYMLAVQTTKDIEGIALTGMVEASAGRLLLELGDYRKGLAQLKRAVKTMKPFTDMHVYHYNMIVTYADIALGSFLLGESKGIESVIPPLEKHYENAREGEKNLSRTYYLLTYVYGALLTKNEELFEEKMEELLKHWGTLEWNEFFGIIFEMESLIGYMISHDYTDHVWQILKVSEPILKDENLSIVLRYYTLRIMYYEKVHNLPKLRENLQAQQEIEQRKTLDTIKTIRYSMEFSDMLEKIAKEREKVTNENIDLQIKANTDSLTGLPNRNALSNYLQQKLDEAREKGTMFGIGIIDIDEFKQYNDKYGHRAGDECLKLVGKALLKLNENPNAFCLRYGGDEFVVGYFGLTTREINKIKKQLQTEIDRRTDRARKERIAISQGVHNAVPDEDKKLWDYLSVADRALYKLKRK